MQTLSIRSVTLASGMTVLVGLAVIALLAQLGPDWAKYAPASCTATRCFCELPRVGALVVQPANAWSSFSHVFIGFLMMLIANPAGGLRTAMAPIAARTFGLTAIVVGVGSMLLHATLTLWGQFYDVMGMYMVVSFMVVSALSRWQRIADGPAVVVYVLLSGALIAVLAIEPELRRWLFAIVLLVAIIIELVFARPRRPQVRLGFYLSGILATAVAFGIWNLDQHGIVCAPSSLIQGHAIWHLLGALSLWFSFCYYRSEQKL
jgi:dihydroceramidase